MAQTINALKLVITNEGQKSIEVALDPARTYSVGRANADIELFFEPLCSRQHATLSHSANGWKLVDEMSSNGTKVGGRNVNFAILAPGVTAVIGKTEIRVEPVAAEMPAARPANGPVPPAANPNLRPGVQPGAGAGANEQDAAGMPERRARPMPVTKSSNAGLIAAGVGGAVVLVVVLIIMNSGGSKPAENTNTAKAEPPKRKEYVASPAEKLQSAWAAATGLASTDADSARSKLDILSTEFAKEIRDAGRVSELDKVIQRVDADLRSQTDKYLKDVIAAARERQAGELYSAAVSELDRVDADRRARSRFWAAELDRNTKLPEIGKLRTEITLQSDQYYREAIADAHGAEAAGSVSEALSVLNRVLERAVLDSDKRAFVETAITRVKTNPSIVVRRIYKPGTATWRPAGSVGGWDDPDSPAPGDPTKPNPDGKPTVAAKLPPNPLFPEGRASEEKLIFDLLESIRLRVLAGQFKPRGIHHNNSSYDVVGATENGIKLTGGPGAVTSVVLWKDFAVEEYAEFTKRTALDKNLDALFGLALLAFERNQRPDAQKTLGTIVTTEATLEAGATIQGLPGKKDSVRTGAELLLASKEGRTVMPTGGYLVFEGSLMSGEQQAGIMFDRKLAGLIEVLKKGLGKKKDSRDRKESDKAFDDIIAMGADAAPKTVAVLFKEKTKLMGEAEAATGLGGDVKALDALATELQKRRDFALELIFDEKKWPYPHAADHDKVLEEVNARVEEVRKIWMDPLSFKGTANPKFEELIAKITTMSQMMDKVDPAYSSHQTSLVEDIEYLSQIANQKLDVKSYYKVAGGKSQMVAWHKTIEWNNATQAKFKGNAEAPNDESWEQLRITNEYRMMMGRAPLKMNFKLYWASQHHSQWCVEKHGGEITHDSPGGPRGDNPSQRCAFEGYSGGTGENIHSSSGGPTPLGAHMSWLGSSGHHRNILGAGWTVMGNAKFDTIWTQNFGGADEGDGNTTSKGGK